MSNQRYTPEFNDEAVRQVVERDYRVAVPNTAVKVRAFVCDRCYAGAT